MSVQETLRLGPDEDFIPSREIEQRITQLGSYYTKLYADYEQIILVPLLHGGSFFGVELSYQINHPDVIWYPQQSSRYNGAEADDDREPSLNFNTDISIKGAHLLIVEDILDKGKTLHSASHRLADQQPASVDVVALFEKPTARLDHTDIAAREVVIGFQITDSFVVGRGLDWKDEADGKSHYRTLPHVTKVTELPNGFIVPKILSEAA